MKLGEDPVDLKNIMLHKDFIYLL